jgi:hypothetical protein
MKRSRIAAPAVLVAIVAATTHLLAADAPASQPPNDRHAEQILRQARDAIGKARRLEIADNWSDVNGHLETEERGREKIYFEKPGGYLFENHPVDVARQTSRALTQSGRAFRLRSSTSDIKQLYTKGSVTFLDDARHSCQTINLGLGDNDDFAKIYKPDDFIGMFIPPGLYWAIDWNDVRSRYRIEQRASTPTTICIGLILRPDSPGYDRSEPERHEIVLDRRTLLPQSWRKVRGDLDSLKTYSRFELDPAPRDLKVPPTGYQESLLPHTRVNFNFNVSDGTEAPTANAEPEADVLLLETTCCLLRLFHLF